MVHAGYHGYDVCVRAFPAFGGEEGFTERKGGEMKMIPLSKPQKGQWKIVQDEPVEIVVESLTELQEKAIRAKVKEVEKDGG